MDMEVQELHRIPEIPDKESHYEKGDLAVSTSASDMKTCVVSVVTKTAELQEQSEIMQDAVNALAEQMAATEASKITPSTKAAKSEE
ncbi:hypothetical protein Aduo_006231 [Ancylostoma duodenale]